MGRFENNNQYLGFKFIKIYHYAKTYQKTKYQTNKQEIPL